MRTTFVLATALAVTFVVGCTFAQQPAAPPTPPPPAPPKNLQVLPKDIPREELIKVMRSFARGLGVRCNHCHVVTATEPREQLDFASDAKEEKRAARVMLRMVLEINGPWMQRVEAAEHGESESESTGPAHATDPRVTCWTCHRGKPEPDPMPPPEN